ncbi:MAG: TetR/AcrR family transcriptional regulator [Curtobacterium sp.]
MPSTVSGTGTVRRRTAKGLRTRSRIVDAAAELMLTRGVAGTTLDDIGATAGVGRSQLYHYFEDKDALVHDVIDRQSDTVLEHQGDDYADLSTWEAWTRWRDRMVDGARAGGCVGGCPLGSLGIEVAERDSAARTLVAAGFTRWEDGFRRGITAMQERGTISPHADPAELATGVMVALQGGLLLAQVHRDVRPLVVGLDTAIAAIRQHAVRS